MECGWKADKIEYWRKCQKEGVMGIHWVVSVFLWLQKIWWRTPRLAKKTCGRSWGELNMTATISRSWTWQDY